MIIDFTVSNFRSIKEPQTLSLLATTDKDLSENTFAANDIEKTRLLKTAVVYGANGSGKSNLIQALQVMLHMIQFSTDEKRGEKIDSYTPFKLSKASANSPIRFELEFIAADHIRYSYGFSFTAYEIEEEFLFFYPKKQEAKLFVREKGKSIDFGDGLTGAKKNIESLLLPNQLFLSKAANNNHRQLGDIYDSVINRVLWKVYNHVEEHYFAVNEPYELESYVYRNPLISNQLAAMLQYADTGIQTISIRKREDQSYRVFTSHKTEDSEQEEIEFSLYEESEGTQKLFFLGAQLLQTLQKRQVVIIDEINNSFHPLITEMIIKLFQNPETNPNNVQLIFTTHDTSVMRSDLFRRDQVWFTEKDTYGATSLYSLAEFDKSKVRSNTPYDKWYLSGRFGALPLIKDFDFLKDTETTPPDA